MARRRGNSGRGRRRSDPVLTSGLVAFGLALGAAAILWWLGLDPLLSWLISISGIAVLAYWYDKSAAKEGRTRVPEKVLLALALLGGTGGALLGMRLFHHKTAKASFQVRFWLVALIQLGLIVAYLWLRYGSKQGG